MRFYLAHQIEGRTRLRAAQRPVELDAFAGFAAELAAQPGIEYVHRRETTGSLVIEHPALSAQQLADTLEQSGGEIVEGASVTGPRRDNLAAVQQTLGGIDSMLGRFTAGSVDVRTLAFLVFFSLGIAQLLRGQIMMPAFSFLWYAFELARRSPDFPADDG